jgi:putative hydrolase of the HAD superfamily
MVGNSLKSDVLPVLELGAAAAHIPYPLTWEHERVAEPPAPSARFFSLAHIGELPAAVTRWIAHSTAASPVT